MTTYDIFHLSYDEPFAEKTYSHLRKLVHGVLQVKGIKGVFNAHKVCAERAFTKLFWVIDADSWITDPSIFELEFPSHNEFVHIWYNMNTSIGQQYGWGGVKLLPRAKLLNYESDTLPVDVSTSLGDMKIHTDIVSKSIFNTDTFMAWRGAFRESAKLFYNKNYYHLELWMNPVDENEFVADGARRGKEFIEYGGDVNKINDYDFLNTLTISTLRDSFGIVND